MLTSRISLALRCRQLLPVQFSSLSCSVLQREQFHSQRWNCSGTLKKNLALGTDTLLPQSASSDCVLLRASSSYVHGTGIFSSTRNFSTSGPRSAKELSEKGDVVYRGAISGMIRGVKLFSLSTSVIGICLQPMLLFSNQELPTGLKFAFGGIINFFVFMNPFIIHYIAKKYVTELRWNRRSGVFTAATWSFLLRRKELQFTAEEVRVPDVPGMFTSLEAKGVPLFFDPKAFEDNEAYIHLMGFDKPLDWEIQREREPTTKTDSQKS